MNLILGCLFLILLAYHMWLDIAMRRLKREGVRLVAEAMMEADQARKAFADERERAAGSLTKDEAVAAARNVGVDLRCGRCASVFYTGGSEHRHDAECETGVLDFAPQGNVLAPPGSIGLRRLEP